VNVRAELDPEVELRGERGNAVPQGCRVRDGVGCVGWFEDSQAVVSAALDDPTAVARDEFAADDIEPIDDLGDLDRRKMRDGSREPGEIGEHHHQRAFLETRGRGADALRCSHRSTSSSDLTVAGVTPAGPRSRIPRLMVP